MAPDRTNCRGSAPRQSRRRRAEARIALLFVLPAILLVLVFRIIPLFWGFGISLTSATSTDPGEFIGAGNYLRALDDPNFRSSIANAAVVLLSVPIFVTIPMLLAILIDQGVPGRAFFRSVYFFPVVLSSVIIGSIFSVVLGFNGSFNALLKVLGLPGRRLAGAFGDRAAGDARHPIVVDLRHGRAHLPRRPVDRAQGDGRSGAARRRQDVADLVARDHPRASADHRILDGHHDHRPADLDVRPDLRADRRRTGHGDDGARISDLGRRRAGSTSPPTRRLSRSFCSSSRAFSPGCRSASCRATPISEGSHGWSRKTTETGL